MLSAIAAQKLNEGDEAGAQQVLDASGLTRLSSDGAVLMRAVAGSLGIGPLDLPWADGPRLWRAGLGVAGNKVKSGASCNAQWAPSWIVS
jgi:hypothetical protein